MLYVYYCLLYMIVVNYYVILLVRFDFVGDIGDICFLDRFIFLWREFLIKIFGFFYFFYWEWILLFWGLDFVFDEVCYFVDVIFFFFGLVLVFIVWFLLWIKIGFVIFLEGICFENWIFCLNKRIRCFVDWIMWYLIEDLFVKKFF